VNSLKHKIVIVAEAAAIAQKNNGDEHPMTIMLRIARSLAPARAIRPPSLLQ
jgi:hypothetical protein